MIRLVNLEVVQSTNICIVWVNYMYIHNLSEMKSLIHCIKTKNLCRLLYVHFLPVIFEVHLSALMVDGRVNQIYVVWVADFSKVLWATKGIWDS